MRPGADRLLGHLSTTLMTEIGPAVWDGYIQRNTMLMAMLLTWIAEEWNRAADRRVQENGELRRLFRESLDAVEDLELRSRLEAAASETDPDVTIETLDRSNDAVRALLIELHAHVETLGTPGAGRVEAEIWRELRRSTERRALSGTP